VNDGFAVIILVVLVVFGLGFALGHTVGVNSIDNSFKKEAIARHYAGYNIKTKQFEWTKKEEVCKIDK